MMRFPLTAAACAALFLTGLNPTTAQVASTEVMSLGLRGVYFVENQGQWSDASVAYGFKSRGLDIAFRESSFTMHLSREVSRDVPVAVVVGPTDGAWASRPYEYQVVQRASRPFECQVVEQASRPSESATAPEASLNRERGFFSFDDSHPLPHGRGPSGESVEYEHLTLTVTFPGSNPATPRGAQPQEAKFNYYIGDDESKWASNVPSYGAIVYENLYDGVNLHITGNDDGVLKYEFHVAPGADWTRIRIAYEGIDSLCVEESGDLRISTSFGTLMDSAPLVWQEDAGTTSLVASTSRAREEAGSFDVSIAHKDPLPDRRGSSDPTIDTIPARFELIDATTYRFALDGPVDPTRTLIIDPEIEWMYYLGGSDQDYGIGIAVDSADNALVTGRTSSTDFAGRNNSRFGSDDAFALKVSPSGELQWMTFLGGSSYDYGNSVAVDSAGNALVAGQTISTDFAGRNNSRYGADDAFALKVSPSGELLWMTYLGGSSYDFGNSVAVDSAGNALVAGQTISWDFAGRNNSRYGDWDAFALKVTPSGEIMWMIYLGGNNYDHGAGIAVDSAGNALVSGETWSTDFAGRNNSHHGREFDAFALKVNPSGQLEWMTYLGGSDWDHGRGIAVDGADNALVTGYTNSTDFAGRNNSHDRDYDAFALKISPSGRIQWMTYLGGSDRDLGIAIAVNGAGNPLVTGRTSSTDFAWRNNSRYGTEDAFALKVSASGELQWMTYVGGSSNEWGKGIVLDSARHALVTGETMSTDFAGRNNSYYGNRDAFIFKLRIPGDGPRLNVEATCPAGGPIRIEWSGATPGGQVALIYARNTGSFIIPNNYSCAGTQLGLGSNQIQLAWQGRSGAEGSRIINASAGWGACGGYLQLLDLSTCATSNVARIE